MATYTTLRNGSKGSDVKKLQQALVDAGYNVGSSGVDGIYGANTAAAVKKYQKDKGLSVDGIAGKQTLGSLYTTSNTNKSNTNTTPATTKLTFEGVDQQYVDITQEKYKPSEEEQNYLDKRNEFGQSLEDKIAAGPQFSESVTKALTWLEGQQEYFKNGKTSWDDEIYGQIDAIKNRDKFSYDVDNDQLFQQALSSAMNSGRSAMQDTIGQASALTGGYGSTYATSAGNQAYNEFIEDAYNNLPAYYNMALDAYRAEGEEMYNLLGLYTQMGEQEWNRNVDAYNTVYDYATSQRDFEYKTYQDDITNTHDLMNMYGDFYKQKNYEGLTMWQQNIDNAWKTIENQIDISQFNKNYKLQENEYKISTGDTDGDGVLSASEKAAKNTTYSYDSEGNVVRGDDTGVTDYSLGKTDIDECKKILANGGTIEDVNAYLKGRGKAPQNEAEADILNNAIGYTNNADGVGAKTKTKAGSVSTAGGVSGFKVDENDNFDVTYEGETYRVENHGKVTSKDLKTKLDSYDVGNKSVFVCEGDAYVKFGTDYYKIGATNILWGKTSGYSNLIKALTKTDK